MTLSAAGFLFPAAEKQYSLYSRLFALFAGSQSFYIIKISLENFPQWMQLPKSVTAAYSERIMIS